MKNPFETRPLNESTEPLDAAREAALKALGNKEEPFTPELIGRGDLLIRVDDVNPEKIYALTVTLGEGQYEMKVDEAQLQKLRDGRYTITTTPSGAPILQSLE